LIIQNNKAPPIVVDRDFAFALKRYAQLLARAILGKKTGGINLSDDIKKALKANIEKLIQELTYGKMSRELLDEYKKIFKGILAKLCKFSLNKCIIRISKLYN
jgi:hypothetical protein